MEQDGKLRGKVARTGEIWPEQNAFKLFWRLRHTLLLWEERIGQICLISAFICWLGGLHSKRDRQIRGLCFHSITLFRTIDALSCIFTYCDLTRRGYTREFFLLTNRCRMPIINASTEYLILIKGAEGKKTQKSVPREPVDGENR